MKNRRNCWQKNQKQQNELFNQMTRLFAFKQQMNKKKTWATSKKSLRNFWASLQ
jgi:hypothetical protein